MYSRLLSLIAIIAVLAASGCPEHKTEWTDDQKAVHAASLEWSKAFQEQDAAALWEMLSPDSKDWYKRELEGEGGLRQTVKLDKAALKPGARTPPEERERIEKFLATLPIDPDDMSPKDYYIWKQTPNLTQENAASTAGAFEKANIQEIEINGDKATMVVKSGKPDRYSWVRHDGVWKFDLPPSILRALEDARKRANENN